MSVIFKKDTWKIKDPNTGEYRDSTVFGSTFVEDTAAVVAEATAAIDAQEARADGIVADTRNDIDAIAASVASIAQLGTDTSLSTQGMAADAKAAGDAIKLYTDIEEIQFTNGYYIATNAAPVDINSPVSSETGFKYAVLTCTEGDRFTITSTGGQTQRAWCFIDSSNEILCNSGYGQSCDNDLIVAPPGSSKLIINAKNDEKSYKGYLLLKKITELEDKRATLFTELMNMKFDCIRTTGSSANNIRTVFFSQNTFGTIGDSSKSGSTFFSFVLNGNHRFCGSSQASIETSMIPSDFMPLDFVDPITTLIAEISWSGTKLRDMTAVSGVVYVATYNETTGVKTKALTSAAELFYNKRKMYDYSVNILAELPEILDNKNIAFVYQARYPCVSEKYILNLRSEPLAFSSATTKGTLKKAMAYEERTFIARKDYSVDDVLIMHNNLYVVTAPIASGEDIVEGKNVSYTTFGDLIKLNRFVLKQTNLIPIAAEYTAGSYVRHSDGTLAASSVYDYSNFVYIGDYNYIICKYYITSIASPAGGIAFYSSDDESSYVSGIQAVGGGSTYSYTDYKIVPVPNSAKYARFSALSDTTTYGERPLIYSIRNIDDSIAEAIDKQTEAIETYTGNAEIQFHDGYIVTSGSTVDINTINISTSGFRYAIVDCEEGDTFTISVTGGSSPRAICFIDSSGNSVYACGANVTYTSLSVVTAPANSAKLIIHDNSNGYAYKGVSVVKRIDNIEKEVKHLEKKNILLQPGYATSSVNGLTVQYNGKTIRLNGTNTTETFFFIKNFDNPPAGTMKASNGFNTNFYTIYNPQNVMPLKEGHLLKIHCRIVSGSITRAGVTYTSCDDFGDTNIFKYFWVSADATDSSNRDAITQSWLPKYITAGRNTIGTFGLYIYNSCTCNDLVVEIYIEDMSFEETYLSANRLYYGEDHWITEIDRAVAAIDANTMAAGIHGSTICFITDCHWNSNMKKSPEIIKRIFERCNIDQFVNGGDYLNAGQANTSTAITEIKNCINAFRVCGKPMYCVFGNHDNNQYGDGQQLNYGQARTLVLRSFLPRQGVTVASDYEYFYWEDDNYRYVGLYWYSRGTTKTLDGIEDIVNTSKPLIIFCHGIYYVLAESAAEDVIDDQWILDNFEPYKNKVRCFIQGHTHRYGLRYAYSNNVPIISCAADKYSLSSDEFRETVLSQCVSFITVTPEEIKVVAVGKGEDFTIDSETPEFTYFWNAEIPGYEYKQLIT